jgi:hypothetical protein
VSHALAKVAHHLAPVTIQDLSIRRARHTAIVLCVLQAPDGSPLLERLVAGLRVHEIVGQAVPDLHARVLARVARVRVVDKGGPVGSRMGEAPRARLVGAEGCARGAAKEASVRDAAVGRAGGEHVRVAPSHDVGHHGTRRGAHDKDAALVRGVLVQRVVDHADDARGVATAVVRQRGGIVHVPAVGVVRRARVDQDEAARVSVRGELGARIPCWRGTSAGVQLHKTFHVSLFISLSLSCKT